MIQIENVSFFYNDIDAVGKKVKYDGVFDINLQIKQGECVVLCGKSGCGKTTLLRMINGLIPHFYEGELQGKVFVAGCDIAKTSLPKLSECVGSVFQNPRSQFFHLDTTGELAFNIENQGLPVKEMKRRVASTIKELNLSHLMERNIFELSGGEKQRIACGTVYAAESEIIVFDEPSSNLDVESIFRLKSVIEALKRAGKTIVVSEHRLWYLWGVADRYVYMEKGMIKNIFTPQQIEDLPVTQRCKMGIRAIQEEELFQKISLQQMKENPDEETNNNGVQIVKLVCKRKGQQVIEIKDLNIPKHAVVAVIGANGVGKSTFCYALSGLLKAKGKVFISDKEYRHNQLKK